MENKNIKENENIQELNDAQLKNVNGGLGYWDEIEGPGMENDKESHGNARVTATINLGTISRR